MNPRTPSLIFSLAALALLACGSPSQAPPPPSVTVAQPSRQPVIDYLEVTGAVVSAESVEIRARVEGFLQSIEFQEGETVEAGQLLYRIDPREYEARVQSARAALATARSSLALAETTLRRRERAFETGAVSELEVLENRSERDVAAARLQSAEADLRRAELDLGYTRIYSPIAGKVGKSEVDPGNLVGAVGKTLLTTVVRYDPIRAHFSISERELLDILEVRASRGAEGPITRVEIGRSTDDGFPFVGTLDFTDQQVDDETGTFLVRGVFENPEPLQLLPGLFVRGRIPIRERPDALLVSERALGQDQSGRYLLTVDDEGIVHQKAVQIGALVDGMRVIEDGISASDRVITNGVLYARPGAPVMIATDVAAAPPAAEAAPTKD